jgi:hypothetical protein
MYLYIFEISAPRGFGEAWAQGHLKELVPEVVKSTKKKARSELFGSVRVPAGRHNPH